MKKVYAREAYCMNCHLCEVNCVTSHAPSRDPVKAYKQPAVRPQPRLWVEEAWPRSCGVACRHCEDPLCVRACISGAMRQDPTTGIVSCDTSRCVGCWTCIAACPFGAIRRGTDGQRKFALKCDLCQGLGLEEPACVAGCPNRALVYAEEEQG